MTASYDNTAVSIAVPLPVSVDNNDNQRPMLATANMGRSSYKLPSSRINGQFAPVPESQIQQLMKQGYTRGLSTSLAQTIKSFPLRIWVVDNSGSMQKTDGHRFVETKRTQDVKVVDCSRWNEIKDCIEYHAQMAAALEAPTTFRMLNDPGKSGLYCLKCAVCVQYEVSTNELLHLNLVCLYLIVFANHIH